MHFKISEYLQNFFQEKGDKIKKLTVNEIVDIILKEDNYINNLYNKRLDTLKRAIYRVKDQLEISKISNSNQPKELKTPYKVIDNKHYFYPIKGEFHLPNDLIDEMFYSYSKHGLDWSSTEMLNHFNLQPWQWHAIKNALRMYKTSNIFSEHSMKNLDVEEKRNIIKEKMDEKVNTTGFIVEQEYYKSVFKQYKDVIRKQTQNDLKINTIINELADLLPEIKITTKKTVDFPYFEREINIVIADIHFGAKNNSSNRHLPELNVDILKDKFFNDIASIINGYEATKVNIFFVGDLIESATGLNHIDSWKGIQEGMYGAKLIKECYEFLVSFLSQINNLNKVIGISGNHDRMTSNKQEDTDGFIAEIIFEFIKLSLKNSDVKVIYDSKLTNLIIDDIVYIMSHGHEKITDNASQLVLKYGDQNKFNVLLSGHWHERRVKSDTDLLRHIVCPSIFPGNNYSVSLGYCTQPGFLIIENNGKGKPIVHDYSI